MKKLFFFSILVLLSLTIHAQHFDWVKGWSGYGGTSDSEVPGNVIKGSVVDSEGNLYIVGDYYPGTKVFGVDPVPLDIATVTTNRSVVIAKLNQEGELVWYKGIYSQRTGNQGTSIVNGVGIRILGDTAIMVCTRVSLPRRNSFYTNASLYYLDTLMDEILPLDTLGSYNASAFITLDLNGNLIEDHFLQISGLDQEGHPFTINDCINTQQLTERSFDIDDGGNIYILRMIPDHFTRENAYIDSTGIEYDTYTIANGGIGTQRIIVDGRGDILWTPQHRTQRWNVQIMKFSPYFEKMVNSVYVFDSTDVYAESDIFSHPTTGVAYVPNITPTSFKIDEDNNIYLILKQYNFCSHMPLSNSDTLAFTGHDHDYYADLLIKYDSSLIPLFAKQLRSTYGTDDPNQCSRRFETGTVEVDSETNTIYMTGRLQKNFDGVADNGVVKIYFDSDTLDINNDFYWLRLDRDNGSFVSYGRVRSDYRTIINPFNSSEPRIALANGKVAATFNYTYNFTFADTTISSGTSYNDAQAMAIWDDMGNEIACHDFNAIHISNRTGGVYVHDSTLYVTGVVYTGATFGDTVLASTGGRSQAFIAKYVNPIFAQSGSSERLPQHITWEQDLDFTSQSSPIALSAYASSGLPVHYTSSNPSVAYIDDGMLFQASEGNATVTATQPGNYIYLAAEPVTKTIRTSQGGQGIDNLEIQNSKFEINIFPNPTTGILHIQPTTNTLAQSSNQTISSLTLHNAMGQPVKTFNSQFSTFNSLDLRELPAGIYYLTVKSGEATTRHKIMKVN